MTPLFQSYHRWYTTGTVIAPIFFFFFFNQIRIDISKFGQLFLEQKTYYILKTNP